MVKVRLKHYHPSTHPREEYVGHSKPEFGHTKFVEGEADVAEETAREFTTHRHLSKTIEIVPSITDRVLGREPKVEEDVPPAAPARHAGRPANKGN